MLSGYPLQGYIVAFDMTKILGLDPGLQCTGWGIVQKKENSLSYVAHGVVKTDAKLTLAERLNTLYQELSKVLEQFQPQEAAVEETFVNQNPVSTLKLGMARGVVLFTPASFGLGVWEYSANKVKKSVVGSGHAQKHQVAQMVSWLLPAMPKNVVDDAADALAVAICHAHHRALNEKLKDISRL